MEIQQNYFEIAIGWVHARTIFNEFHWIPIRVASEHRHLGETFFMCLYLKAFGLSKHVSFLLTSCVFSPRGSRCMSEASSPGEPTCFRRLVRNLMHLFDFSLQLAHKTFQKRSAVTILATMHIAPKKSTPKKFKLNTKEPLQTSTHFIRS